MGLALTMLHKPKILILDEPTNGLDPAGIKSLRDILKKVAHENNTAVFVSSHILSEMQLMCDKVAVIKEGRIVKVEEMSQVVEDNQGEVECTIKVKQVEKAIEILNEKFKNYKFEIVENKIVSKIEKENVSKIVKELVLNDIEVETVTEKESSLEDLFFDVTEEEKKHE